MSRHTGDHRAGILCSYQAVENDLDQMLYQILHDKYVKMVASRNLDDFYAAEWEA